MISNKDATPREHTVWVSALRNQRGEYRATCDCGKLFVDQSRAGIDSAVKRHRAAPDRDAPPEALPCGCVPHVTRMSHFGTAVWCETEQNAYCNFECPHEEEGE